MAFMGDWGRRNSPHFSAFAVGFLLVAVFFHLIPDAVAHSQEAWMWMFSGFVLMIILSLGLRVYTRRRVSGEDLTFGYASILALGFHSVLDGVIYETAFQQEFFTASLATFGLLLHEFPEGVIAFFLLRTTGMSVLSAGIWAFVAASLTTIAGAIAAAFFIENVSNPSFASMIGLTAGGLLYVVFLHLAPHAALTPHRRGYFWASVGVVVALAAIIFNKIAGVH